MERRKRKIDQSKKVIIRGVAFYPDQLKADSINESTIAGIIDHLAEVGEVARAGIKSGNCVESLVRESCLPRLEAILRAQLKRYTDAWSIDINTVLETTSDFLHLRDFFLNQDEDSRPAFLFDFLSDVVSLSSRPQYMDSENLDRLSLNLRALSFLTINQNSAATKRDHSPFDRFFYHIWAERCASNPKVSAKLIWNKAVSFIEGKGSPPLVDENLGVATYSFEFGLSNSGSQYVVELHRKLDDPSCIFWLNLNTHSDPI